MMKMTKRNWLIAIATIVATGLPPVLHNKYMLNKHGYKMNWNTMQYEKEGATFAEVEDLDNKRTVNTFVWAVVRFIVCIYVSKKYIER